MRHLPLKELVWAAAFLVLLMAVYVGSYYAVVDRRPDDVFSEVEVPVPFSGPGGVAVMTTKKMVVHDVDPEHMKAAYPLKMMETIYTPIHSVDRHLRRDYWSPLPAMKVMP
jgi:hypothetical protein